MNTLELDDVETRMFEHALSGYGAVVYGGTPEERESAISQYLPEPRVVVDGREIESGTQFMHAVVLEALDDLSEEDLEKKHIFTGDVAQALGDSYNILVVEFDSMDAGTQTEVAQSLKGVCESSSFEGLVGFTAEKGDAVVSAEFDLSGRVKSYELS